MTSRLGGRVVNEDTAKVTTILAKQDEHALVGDDANLDETTLAALGYKQEFKRYVAIHPSSLDRRLNTEMQGFHHMDLLFRLVLCPWTAPVYSVHTLLLVGILWNWWCGMGLANSSADDSVRCLQHGRAVFKHANCGRTGKWTSASLPTDKTKVVQYYAAAVLAPEVRILALERHDETQRRMITNERNVRTTC